MRSGANERAGRVVVCLWGSRERWEVGDLLRCRIRQVAMIKDHREYGSIEKGVGLIW